MQATRLTAEDLVDLPIPQQIDISPSGKRISYVTKCAGQARDKDVSTIWVAKVDEPLSARQVTSGLYHDRLPLWAPDKSKRLAFLSDRMSKGDGAAVYLMHREHFSEPVLLTPHHTERPIVHLAWSPDGRYLAFSGQDPSIHKDREPGNDAHVYELDWKYHHLFLLDVKTRKVTTIYSGPSHVSDFVWHSDSSTIYCLLHKNPTFDAPVDFGVEFVALKLGSAQSSAIGRFAGPIRSKACLAEHAIFFTAGRTPGRICSATGLYSLNIDTGAIDLITGGGDSDAHGVVGLRDTRIVHVRQNLFDELWTRTGHSMFKLLLSVPHEISCFHAIQTSDDTTVVAFVQSNAQAPPEIFSFTMPGPFAKPSQAPVQMSSHGEHLTGMRLARAHEVICKSFDKHVSLRGMLFVPEGYHRSQGPLATVCLIHGGPYARVSEAFIPESFTHLWSTFLVSTGRYAIVCPNYRGSSAQGDEFALAGHGRMGTVDYDDTLAAVEEGIQRKLFDPKRIIVAGWGQGGFLSYLSAVRNGFSEESGRLNGWQYRGAICGAGVTEWDMANMTSFSLRYGAELVGAAPWDRSRHDVRAREASAVWELRSTEAKVPPTLILHGEDDIQVPLSQAIAYLRAAKWRDYDCQMVTYPREGHDIRERAHKIDMLHRVLRFCDQHTDQGAAQNV